MFRGLDALRLGGLGASGFPGASASRLPRCRRAFTIVELMMVVGIIGILLGVVTTAAATSIKQARGRKASACCALVEQAFNTYYAQKGQWPGDFGKAVKNGSLGGEENALAPGYEHDPDQYELSGDEVDEMIKDIIKEAKQGNPMLDLSGLYVSLKKGNRGDKDFGLDFMDAIRGSASRKRNKMSTTQMHFGYPETDSGYFRHFWVTYSIAADTIKVQKMPSDGRRQKKQ